MSASWVAGSVRAKALAGRRLGAAGARAVAAQPDLAGALTALAGTPYGREVHPGQSLAEAQHAVAATRAVERPGARRLAPPRRGDSWSGCWQRGSRSRTSTSTWRPCRAGPPTRRTDLGTAATAWTRLAGTTTLTEVDDVLTASPWHVRGARDAARAAARDPRSPGRRRSPAASPRPPGGPAPPRRCCCSARPSWRAARCRRPGSGAARAILGPSFALAATDPAAGLAGARAALTGSARWVLDGVQGPEDLWRAEATWWHRVERDGFALLRGSGYDRAPVVGAAGPARHRRLAGARRPGDGRPRRRRPGPGGVRWRGVRRPSRSGCSGWRSSYRRPGCREMLVLVGRLRHRGARPVGAPRLARAAGPADLGRPTPRAAVRTRRASAPSPAGCRPSQVAPLTARLADPSARRSRPSRHPRGVDPPTLLRAGTPLRRSFAPLVDTYGDRAVRRRRPDRAGRARLRR